jgi:quercetin dioxygenase-like cupin family protein
MRSVKRDLWMPGGVRTEIHLDGGDTADAFCLLVDHPPAGWSLPPHLHLREAETMHVIAGEFEVEIDGRQSRMGPGDTVHVPQGTVHAGRNVGEATGRRVLLFSPAGIERFFVEVGRPHEDDEVELSAVLAAAGRSGWEFVAEERRI